MLSCKFVCVFEGQSFEVASRWRWLPDTCNEELCSHFACRSLGYFCQGSHWGRIYFVWPIYLHTQSYSTLFYVNQFMQLNLYVGRGSGFSCHSTRDCNSCNRRGCIANQMQAQEPQPLKMQQQQQTNENCFVLSWNWNILPYIFKLVYCHFHRCFKFFHFYIISHFLGIVQNQNFFFNRTHCIIS